MAPLQPGRHDARQACLASIRIALEAADVCAAREIRRIGLRHQARDRVRRRLIESLNHKHARSCSATRSGKPPARSANETKRRPNGARTPRSH
jgi:hypothetical protein